MTAMMLFGKYIDADHNGNISRSPTDETDDTSSMHETSRKRIPNQLNGFSLELSLGHVYMGESSRKKRTTNPNQVNGLSLELSLGSIGHVDMGESSRKKRKLTTTNPCNQEINYYLLGLPLESFAKIVERNLTTRIPSNQEGGLSLGLPTASSTQEQYQPASMQNPNQVDGLSLGLPLSSYTQLEDQPAMQNPNQEDEEKEEGEEVEQKQQQEEEVVEEEEQHQQQQQEEEEDEVVEEEEEQQQQEEEEEVEEEEHHQQQQQAPAPAPIPIFMFEKKLTSSDVERNHNRLLISGRVNDLMAFLTEEERGRVESNGRRDFLRVVAMTRENYGIEYTLHLKRWPGSRALVLKHEWGKLVRANKLQIGDSVEARGYRLHDQFRLLLNIIRNHQVH